VPKLHSRPFSCCICILGITRFCFLQGVEAQDYLAPPFRVERGGRHQARVVRRMNELSPLMEKRGGGEGVLIFRGKRFPFTASGMSVGFTIGASTTKLVGRALNLSSPASIEGTYSAIGAGGAVAAGAGGVQMQNANGAILQLSRPKVGAEVSAAVGGVTVRLKSV
jgi:hypothetical protein